MTVTTGTSRVLLRLAAAAALVAAAIVTAWLAARFGATFITYRYDSEPAGALPTAIEQPAGSPRHVSIPLLDEPQKTPQIQFADGGGKMQTLAAFRGRMVVVSVWATWCRPCRREILGLDQLQALLGGKGFEVIALAIDQTGGSDVRSFLEQSGVRNLATYIDANREAARKLGVTNLPTTFLIDPQGREIGHLIGSADWNSKEMVDFLQGQLTRKAGRRTRRPRSPRGMAPFAHCAAERKRRGARTRLFGDATTVSMSRTVPAHFSG